MRFLIDAQLPSALARWISDHGRVAEHVAQPHLEAASDSAIWDFAIAASAVLVTKDEEFARWKALSKTGPPIVWIRFRMCAGVPCERRLQASQVGPLAAELRRTPAPAVMDEEHLMAAARFVETNAVRRGYLHSPAADRPRLGGWSHHYYRTVACKRRPSSTKATSSPSTRAHPNHPSEFSCLRHARTGSSDRSNGGGSARGSLR